MTRSSFGILILLAACSAALAQPATVGVLDLGVSDPSVGGAAHAADTVSWWEVVVPSDGPVRIDTCGSSFDTELGVYNAAGDLLDNNDDFCGLQSGVAPFLSSGSYYAAVSGFNTTFNPSGFDVVAGAASGDIVITAAAQPPATVATFDLNSSTMEMDLQSVAPEQIVWYEILHPGGELTVTTTFPETTLLGPFSDVLPDTEIGLFGDDGVLIASNDDEDFGNDILTSLLVEDLPAGTYFAATGGFNSSFSDGFAAASTNANSGDIKFGASVVPEPATVTLVMLAILGLVGYRRR